MTTIEIRKELGFSEQKFADKFGVSVETVKCWDTNDCMPDYIILELVKELNIWRTLYKKKIISFI